MRLSLLALPVGIFLTVTQQLPAYSLQNLTTNVVTTSGTAGGGNTFPGAVVPFGMEQWSPDTTPSEAGGYLYTATQITGFSLDHISGAGDPYGGDFAFTPILTDVTASPAVSGSGKTAFAATFSHANEIAVPGYYSVQFTNGIRTELTATTRAGFGRFTYPVGGTVGMVINAGSGAISMVNAFIQINPNGQEVSGWATQNGFDSSGQKVTVYFDAIFDHGFSSYAIWNGSVLTTGGTDATGTATGAYLKFNLPAGGTVLARTALSYVSIANAQSNLLAEIPNSLLTDDGFATVTSAASNNWNSYLNKIQISGGTTADTQTFYTMMYHALQAPSIVSDANGQYMGFDGQVHNAIGFTKYEYFSGWDIYRNECQFVAMMDPARAGDMAESLVQDAQDSGAMPRWSVADGDTGVMIGDAATPIIADFYAFGATNFNTTSALAAMVKAAIDPTTKAVNGIFERSAERDYLDLGYVPEAQSGGTAPVSMTLEYCSADAALARFAQALGDATNYTFAMNRAQNWRNLYVNSSGYIQMRRSDGLWAPGFMPTGSSYDNNSATDEGSASQYTWMVPFNLGSLIALMGGPQAAAARLDTFFTLINDGEASQYAYVGNEPCSQTPWIYNYVGQPYKASTIVRSIMTQCYSAAPAGLPGNDDLGQMASWYVLAALGMHPEIPGDDVLTLNGPLFPQIVIDLADGDVIITSTGAGDNAPYIQSFSINGQLSNQSWLRFADVARGANLNFTMSTAPNTNWGSDFSLAPPSYMDGMTSSLAPNYLWGTGLELSDPSITWTNVVDVGTYPAGGSNNIGGIKSGVPGPELGIRSENSQSGSSEIMFSGQALGGATNYAYMKGINLGSQNITITPGMHFSYWIFPQSQTNYASVSGYNSLYVALDLIFADGTNLRDSGLVDQHGVSINPANQGSVLTLDTWNYVTVDLTSLAGKIVSRIDLGYNQPNSSGGYRGYVDDIEFSIPIAATATNLALNQPATTDSAQAGYPASNGNDGNLATYWSADDINTNHWWQVDLGGLANLTGDEVGWPTNGVIFDYSVAVSMDNVHWTTLVNKAMNTDNAQDQTDIFVAAGRYVRLTVTGLPSGYSAGFSEFRVFGNLLSPPAIPATLNGSGGYHLASLNWSAVEGAMSYNVLRSTTSGNEMLITNVVGTNFTDFGLVPGTTYYYVVTAVNTVGISGKSSEVSATPTMPAPGSYAAAIMSDNPVAYWPLNETNGSIALDFAGGNNGFYVGGVTLAQTGISQPGFAPDANCPLFDGTSGYVDFPETSLNITGAVTVIVWINDPAPSHFAGIIGRGNASWRLSITATGNPGACDGDNGDATSSTSIANTGWHMLTYVYTGTPNVPGNGSLYMDGMLVAQDTVPTIVGSSYDTWIGGSPDYGLTRLFAGKIAQAAIFSQAFSSGQIQSLLQAANTSPPVTLTIYSSGDGKNLNLLWAQGTLLQATNLLGPWTTNTATSPCIIKPTSSQMYFKLLAK